MKQESEQEEMKDVWELLYAKASTTIVPYVLTLEAACLIVIGMTFGLEKIL